MDVPLSRIEYLRSDTTEANIKGALDQKYITAILPRKRSGEKEAEQLRQEIYRALRKVYESVPRSVVCRRGATRGAREKVGRRNAAGCGAVGKRCRSGQAKARRRTRSKLPEGKLETQNAAEQGMDIYTKAKRDIFEFYEARLKKIGRNGRNIKDYYYQEQGYSERKKFDREKTDGTMLLKLKVLVERLEEREAERSKRR